MTDDTAIFRHAARSKAALDKSGYTRFIRSVSSERGRLRAVIAWLKAR